MENKSEDNIPLNIQVPLDINFEECILRNNEKKDAPTFAERDFPAFVSRGELDGLLPNPSVNQGPKYSTPNEISSDQQIHFKNFKTDGLSGMEIKKIAKNLLGKSYKGLIPENQIKSSLPCGCYLIGILAEKMNQMNHCTALYVTDNHPWEYFDSLGIPLPLDKVFVKEVLCNKTQFQDQNFNTCGLHAVYFLRERLETNSSMERVMNSYPSTELNSLHKNDVHVIDKIYIKYLSI